MALSDREARDHEVVWVVVQVRGVALAGVGGLGLDLGIQGAGRDLGVLFGDLHALDPDVQVRAGLVGRVQALIDGHGEGGVGKLAHIGGVLLQRQVEQGIELGGLGQDRVLGLEQVLLRRGQFGLGLQHVQTGLEAHVVEGLGDLVLRLQTGHGVLVALDVGAGLQKGQKGPLHALDQGQFRVGELGFGLILGQGRLLVGAQQLEAGEKRLGDGQLQGVEVLPVGRRWFRSRRGVGLVPATWLANAAPRLVWAEGYQMLPSVRW